MQIFAKSILFSGLTISMAVVHLGCASRTQSVEQSAPSMENGKSKAISQEQAIRIAKAHLAKKGWQTVEVGTVTFESDQWLIPLTRIPYAIAMHVTVIVSQHGKILRVEPGA